MSNLREIERGRVLYQEKRFKSAIEAFTRAADSCTCHRGGRREKCKCKDFGGAAARGRGEIFKEAMHNCQCGVGRAFSKCSDSTHIMALDYRAATFEAAGKLDYARRDAEWILELAPRMLEGYLRLGKVVRLQGDAELAWKIYSAGVDVGRDAGLVDSSKFQQLCRVLEPLRKRFQTMDILALPFELVTQILSHLDIHQLSQLMRVSKQWYRALDGMPDVWSDLCFDRRYRVMPKTAPSPSIKDLAKIVRRAGDHCRSITIRYPISFGILPKTDRKFVTLLHATRNVSKLDMGSILESYSGDLLGTLDLSERPSWVLASLTELNLTGQFDSAVVAAIIARSSETLQSMTILKNQFFFDNVVPHMPQLRRFKLLSTTIFTQRFDMMKLAASTPKLEQLWTEFFHDDGGAQAQTDRDRFYSLWPNLQVFVWRNSPISGWRSVVHRTGYRKFPPIHPRRLRVLEYAPPAHLSRTPNMSVLQILPPWHRTEDAHLQNAPLQGTAFDDTPFLVPSFDNLEVLRVPQDCIGPHHVKAIAEKAVADDRLRELAIGLVNYGDRLYISDHLDGYGWLRGATSLRTLAIHNFSMSFFPPTHGPPVVRGHTENQQNALVSFILSFPNLETLELVDREAQLEEVFPIFRRVIEAGRPKTFYYSPQMLPGARLDELRQLARRTSVQLAGISMKPKREWWD